MQFSKLIWFATVVQRLDSGLKRIFNQPGCQVNVGEIINGGVNVRNEDSTLSVQTISSQFSIPLSANIRSDSLFFFSFHSRRYMLLLQGKSILYHSYKATLLLTFEHVLLEVTRTNHCFQIAFFSTSEVYGYVLFRNARAA